MGERTGSRKEATRTGPDIVLALGGGGARGLAQIPVLEALDDLGIKPRAIAGTSIGALIGSGYAAGMSGREVRAYAIELFSDRSNVFSRLWQLRPRRVLDIFAGTALGQIDAEKTVALFLPERLPQTFAELAIPLTVVATDYYGWSEARLMSGPLRPAIAASIAIPTLFRAVPVDGRVMIDGGVVNPLPADIVIDACPGALSIAVDVIGGPEGGGKAVPGALESAFGALQLMMQRITKGRLADRAPDILLRPAIHSFRVLDFLKVRAILRAAEPVRDEVKYRIEAALDR